MAVREGYKQTEVGVIPNDWGAIDMGSLAHIQRGASPRPISSPIWFDKQSSIGWLRISDATKAKKYLLDTTQSLSELGIAHSRFVKQGCLVMSICATVGRPILLCKNVCIHDGFVVFNTLQVDKEYLYYVLTDIEGRWSKHGQTGSQMNLNTGLINSTPIPVPPTKAEQTAIANALSDVDALIQSLDALISKKRLIKQGAMQTLLNPYDEQGQLKDGWVVKKLGGIVSLYQPETISARQFTSEGYPVYGANGVVGFFDKYNHKKWQVTVTCRGSTCGTINRTIDKCWITGNAMVLNCEDSNQVDKSFLYYLLLNQDLSICISGTGQPQIVRSPLANFEVGILSDKSKQPFIATILSDMDAEITALETKLTKVQAIKQGMMQNLLTGKIRLLDAQELAHARA